MSTPSDLPLATLRAYLAPDRLASLAVGQPLAERDQGSAVFADISGFTPLTEALNAQWGPRRGAEELGRRLDAVYTALIAEVEAHRGSVIGFAGDAILCWFSATTAPSAARAVGCAFQFQKVMSGFSAATEGGGLGIKVSVATGTVRRLVAGDPACQLHDALAGATIARLALGEHFSQRGEVVLDDATRALLPHLEVRYERHDAVTSTRFTVVTSFEDSYQQLPAGPLAGVPLEALRPWVPATVYQRVTAGQQDFLAEFRPCVALFVHFEGIAWDTDEAGNQLDTFTRRLQALAQQRGGELLQITIGDKGSYAYLAFGAVQAHEDDSRRAVATGLAIRDLGPALGFLSSIRVGISQGTLFVGTYGGPTRRVFSALGDEVNIAARLMQTASPGEVLVTGRVRFAVDLSFVYKEGASLKVKGKSDAIQAFVIAGPRTDRSLRLQEPDYSLPVAGRKVELDAMSAELESALAGRRSSFALVGDAGLGKSRLLAELVRRARERSFASFGGACQSDGQQTPYLPWRTVWNAFFDVDPGAPLRRQLRAIEGLLEDLLPDRLDALPLLGPVLGLEFPDTDLTRGLDPQARKATLHALLADLLSALSGEEPVLLVLEDLHWIDALSLELLADLLAPTGGRVLVALAFRPPETGSPLARFVEAHPGLKRLPLGDLPREAMLEAAQSQWFALYPHQRKAPGASFFDTLLRLAQGNPFYMEELFRYFRDRGIDPADENSLAQIDMPESLQSLILARIDQLSASQKLTLKVASVVGRLFNVDWLPGFSPELGDLDQVKSALRVMEAVDLTPLDAPEPELRYLFKHIVTHEVSYASLPFDLRERLHERLAFWLESTFTEHPPVDALASHFGRTTNRAKQVEYYRKAADAAAKAFANEAALTYLEKLQELAADPVEKANLLLERSEVLDTVGNIDAAEACSRQALALAEKGASPLVAARAVYSLGVMRGLKGESVEAQELLQRANDEFAALGEGALQAAALCDQGLFLARNGTFDAAEAKLHQSLEVARLARDDKAASSALNYLGSIAHARGNYQQARDFYGDSLTIKRRLGDRHKIALTLNNLGVVATDEGLFEEARALFQESLTLRRSMGNKSGIAATLANMANVEDSTGNYAAAVELVAESVALFRGMGEVGSLCTTLSILGWAQFRAGDVSTAWATFRECLQTPEAARDRVSITTALIDMAGILSQAGELSPAAVLQSAAQTLKVAIGLDLSPLMQSTFDTTAAVCRERLEPQLQLTLTEQGAGLTEAQAIELALSLGLP